jgi:hypothetical protein
MPSNDRLRLYYKQRIPPIEEPGQDNQADSGCRIHPPWLDTTLFE